MTHPISKALGIADEDDTMIPSPTPNLPAQEEMVEDFETVRHNTNSLIKDSMGAVQELVQIASYSQDHEAYQSLALLMKTALQANRDLVNLQFKRNVMLQGAGGPTTINSKNTIVMTTAEAMEMIEKKK
jgi:hypothetical protein